MKLYTLIIISFFLLNVCTIRAQSFAERFFVGLYGGVNSSLVSPTTNYSIVSGNAEVSDKTYAPFYENLGMQVGFLARFDILPELTVSLEPGYTTYSFGYGNRYQWQGVETIRYELDYRHRTQFVDIPLFLEYKKYVGNLQPYVKGGGYMGTMLGASSEVVTNLSSQELGEPQSTSENGDISSANAFVPFQYGLAAGAGIRYLIGSTLIGLDFTYKFPMSELSNTRTRFANSQLSGGFYDVADDIMMHNFAINLQIIVPFFKKGGSTGGGGRGRSSGVVPCPAYF